MYLAHNEISKKNFYLKSIVLKTLKTIKIISIEKQLSFKKQNDNCFFFIIKKDSPKDLYENLKIHYALQILFSQKKINTNSLAETPIKIILKYDDKDLLFYFDNELYERLLEIMNQICFLKNEIKNNENLNNLMDKQDMNLRKCEHCFFMSQCVRNF